jgi:membrane protein YqaA with SNARE-associated domain
LTEWVIGTFASPIGVVVLAALDSTLFFSLPFGIDAAVIILAARRDHLAWLVPLLAATGSMAGTALTFWMGRKIGDNGLERYVPSKRLDRVRNRIKNSGAIALALLDLIPPPFPFTPFILAAGALEVRASVFFVTLFAVRLVRFGIEGWLAIRYGEQILDVLESDPVQNIIVGCIALAAVLTVYSVVRLVRSARASSSRTASA